VDRHPVVGLRAAGQRMVARQYTQPDGGPVVIETTDET